MTRRNDPVPISCLDDKHTALLFDLNAASIVEQELGINAMTPAGAMRLISGLNGPGALRCVVRACLIHQDPNLTMARLSKLIDDPAVLWQLVEPCWRAFMHWHGKTDEEFDAMLKSLAEKVKEDETTSEAAEQTPLVETA